MTPAKRIATAIAQSGTYHKRTAVLAALIALGCCIATLVFEQTPQKSLALAMAVIFFFGAYRSLRRANLYFGLKGSPVLEAITQSPRRIATVRASEQGGAKTVVVIDADENQLALRAGSGAGDLEELLEAFRQHAPRAKVEGVSPKAPGVADAPVPPGGRSSSTAHTPDG